MQTTFSVEFTDAVFGILNEFDLKFPNVRELGECVESLSDELILFSIRELKHMADLLKKVVTPLPSPKRNSKLSLSKWVAEVLLEPQTT